MLSLSRDSAPAFSVMAKDNHSLRITFRVTPEEYSALKYIAGRDGFRSVSDVVRTVMKSRLKVIMDIARARLTPDDIGDEIREMFRNCEEDGRNTAFPPNINRRL